MITRADRCKLAQTESVIDVHFTLFFYNRSLKNNGKIVMYSKHFMTMLRKVDRYFIIIKSVIKIRWILKLESETRIKTTTNFFNRKDDSLRKNYRFEMCIIIS